MTSFFHRHFISLRRIFIALVFVYFFVQLYRTFAYWGLGLGIITLFSVILFVILWNVVVLFVHHRRRIMGTARFVIKKIGQTRLWRRWASFIEKRFPRLYAFSERRLVDTSPLGLPFTLGIGLSMLFLVLFIGQLINIVLYRSFALIDMQIIHMFQLVASNWLTSFFVFITVLGSAPALTVGFILIAFLLMVYGLRRTAFYFMVSVIGGNALSSITKLLIQRPRPLDVNLINLPQSFSLPSGHAVVAVCFYGFIAYLVFKYVRGTGKKITWIIALTLLTFLIGASRVYLGLHFSSDIIAGWYLGLAWLIFVLVLQTTHEKLHPLREFSHYGSFLLDAVALVVACAVIIAATTSYHRTERLGDRTASKSIAKVSDVINYLGAYSQDFYGFPMAPFSFIVVGDRSQLLALFNRAGWYKADRFNFNNIFESFSAASRNKPYAQAPMTPAFYNSMPNELGFEKPTEDNTARKRHHTRYWDTGFSYQDREIWVATASFDEGIGLGSAVRIPTHKINPNIDAEREYIFSSFESTGLIESWEKIQLVPPEQGVNATGESFYTDGKAYLIYLKG